MKKKAPARRPKPRTPKLLWTIAGSLSAVLVGLIAVQGTPSWITASLSDFPDVTPDRVDYQAINTVRDRQIMTGYYDGTFGPDNSLTRAELAAILVRVNVAGEVIQSCTEVVFPDLDPYAWYLNYVCVAKEKNFVEGYPDGTFGPNISINAAEVSKVIALGFQLPITTQAPNAEQWYMPYVDALYARNAFPSTITYAGQFVTRGEVARMIAGVLSFKEQEELLAQQQQQGQQGGPSSAATGGGSSAAAPAPSSSTAPASSQSPQTPSSSPAAPSSAGQAPSSSSAAAAPSSSSAAAAPSSSSAGAAPSSSSQASAAPSSTSSNPCLETCPDGFQYLRCQGGQDIYYMMHPCTNHSASSSPSSAPSGPSIVGDFVWRDTNANGIQDAEEPGIGGITVHLMVSGSTVGTTTTNSSGFYSFSTTALPAGDLYWVQIVIPTDYVITGLRQGSDPTKDNDLYTGGTGAWSDYFALATGGSYTAIDAGLKVNYQVASSSSSSSAAVLGDFVWKDTNANGVQDPGEPGFAGVTVKLMKNSTATAIATTTTNASGFYSFNASLITSNNEYWLEIAIPGGYVLSGKDLGGNDAKDNDFYPGGSGGWTDYITVTNSTSDITKDAGLKLYEGPVLSADMRTTAGGGVPANRNSFVGFAGTLYNNGPNKASNVILHALVPQGLTFNAEESNTYCQLVSGEVQCAAPNLNLNSGGAYGLSIAFNIPVSVPCGSTIQYSVWVTSGLDPVSSNNQSNVISRTVTCPP